LGAFHEIIHGRHNGWHRKSAQQMLVFLLLIIGKIAQRWCLGVAHTSSREEVQVSQAFVPP
jgi:hypothetical protein